MKKPVKQSGFMALMALIVIMAACDNGMVGKPDPFRTPTADDYSISNNLNQIVGSVTDVTVKVKPGKSPGTVTVYYTAAENPGARSMMLPTQVGTYTVPLMWRR